MTKLSDTQSVILSAASQRTDRIALPLPKSLKGGAAQKVVNALIDKGWVKVHNFSESKNKFGYVYLLTPSGIAEKAALTGRFLQRKLLEYEAMRAEIESLRGEGGEVNSSSQVPAGTKVSHVKNIVVGGV